MRKSKNGTLDKSSYAYRKYIAPAREREKQAAHRYHGEWISNNWINFASLVVSILALATAVIALLK